MGNHSYFYLKDVNDFKNNSKDYNVIVIFLSRQVVCCSHF